MLFKRHRFASFTIDDADRTLCYTDIIIRQQSGWLVKVVLVALNMETARFALTIKRALYVATALVLFLGIAAVPLMLTNLTSERASSSVHLPIASGAEAHAVSTLEERKLPMRFTWVACQPNCRGWVAAVGVVTADTPNEFDAFAREHQLVGATIVLNSSGGSVNDAIALGRRWRSLGMLTTVGASIKANGRHAYIAPEAYCESMCVFLLLSGKVRYVPDGAHVRVHQIWFGDRAHDAMAASYSAHDIMILERDIGRLAKYTFEMGGGGDLLSLSLSVPPWTDLYELSPAELRLTNLVTAYSVAEVLPPNGDGTSADDAGATSVKDRIADEAKNSLPAAKSIRAAEANVPTGCATASAYPAQPQTACGRSSAIEPSRSLVTSRAPSALSRSGADGDVGLE